MIIFNELEYAEKLIDNSSIGNNVRQKDLNIIARYWKHMGLSEKEIRDKLIEFYEANDAHFNEVLYDQHLEYAVRASRGAPLRAGESVKISRQEMAKIREIESLEVQRVLFTMLAIAKVFCRGKEFYYNGKITDVFRLARLTGIRVAQRNSILHWLNTNGFIEANLYGGYKIPFGERDIAWNQTFVTIQNLDKIMDYFAYKCASCKKDVFKGFNKHMLCGECRAILRKEQIKINVRNHRRNQKNS